MALMEHKSYRDRYRLFLFLTWNGMDPTEALHVVQMDDIKKGQRNYNHYDRSAQSQFKGMYEAALNGKLFQTNGDSSIFDMTEGKVVKLNKPF